jgi:hypothetical protein
MGGGGAMAAGAFVMFLGSNGLAWFRSVLILFSAKFHLVQ